MSTILIDRRTAALLGELAAERPVHRSGGTTTAAVATDRGAAGRATRPVVAARAEILPARREVTVRRAASADSRLRRRMRCAPDAAGRRRASAGRTPDARPASAGRTPGALHLTRRGRLVLVLLFLTVLTVAFSVGRVTSTAVGGPDGQAAEVVVQRGDTLWSISERVAPDTDPRATANDLMVVNGLASPSLEVGQRLRLP